MSTIAEGRTGRILAWRDAIPLHYEYTAGVAGEAFLRGLKEGRIIVSKCLTCGEMRIPPRAYCLECYGRSPIQVELLHLGSIAALTTPRPPRPRGTVGYVVFEGVSGGLVHRIIHKGRKSPKAGDPVTPQFASPEGRKGSILDLEGFKTRPRRQPGKR